MVIDTVPLLVTVTAQPGGVTTKTSVVENGPVTVRGTVKAFVSGGSSPEAARTPTTAPAAPPPTMAPIANGDRPPLPAAGAPPDATIAAACCSVSTLS